MIKAAYDKGHTIGMHTYSHDYAKVYASVDAYFQDLDQIGQMVQEEIGYVPCFIRFPGGSSNTVSADYVQGLMTTLTKAVHEKGYEYLTGTVILQMQVEIMSQSANWFKMLHYVQQIM